MQSSRNLREFHSRYLKYLRTQNSNTQHNYLSAFINFVLHYLLEVLVVVDELPLRGVLQSVAAYVLPHCVDDVGSLGRVDTQQPSKLTGQLVLDRLERTQAGHGLHQSMKE